MSKTEKILGLGFLIAILFVNIIICVGVFQPNYEEPQPTQTVEPVIIPTIIPTVAPTLEPTPIPSVEPTPEPIDISVDISEVSYPVDLAFDVREFIPEFIRVEVGQIIGLKVQYVPSWNWVLNEAQNIQLMSNVISGTDYWVIVKCIAPNTETSTNLFMVNPDAPGAVGMRIEGLVFAVAIGN